MKILSIETSGLVASVAVAEDGFIKAEFTIENKLTHSETLLPMIRDMLKVSGIELKEIDAIAVSAGPGSFTGLRIGVATAKGLAVALDIPVIKVGTLDAMGLPISLVSDKLICPLIDARRKQVYCAAYLKGKKVIAWDACDIKIFFKKITDYVSSSKLTVENEYTVCFLGDGSFVYENIILDLEKEKNCFNISLKPEILPTPFNREKAGSLAYLGENYYRRWLLVHKLKHDEVKKIGAFRIDFFDDVVMNSDELVPIYLRKSQAEQNAEAGRLKDPGQNSLKKMLKV